MEKYPWDEEMDRDWEALEEKGTIKFLEGMLVGIITTLILTYSLLYGLGVLA